MAKEVFGVATDVFDFDSTEYDVTGLSLDQESPKVDTTDTGTAADATEALGGRITSDFTVNLIKDTSQSDIALKTAAAGVLNFGSKTYSGTFILFTKNTTGEIDNRIEQTYTGSINGTVTEG